MKPAATVVLPTYNRPHLLERSLRALLAQDPSTPAFEVVVVDDGSEPETGEAVQADRPHRCAGELLAA